MLGGHVEVPDEIFRTGDEGKQLVLLGAAVGRRVRVNGSSEMDGRSQKKTTNAPRAVMGDVLRVSRASSIFKKWFDLPFLPQNPDHLLDRTRRSEGRALNGWYFARGMKW